MAFFCSDTVWRMISARVGYCFLLRLLTAGWCKAVIYRRGSVVLDRSVACITWFRWNLTFSIVFSIYSCSSGSQYISLYVFIFLSLGFRCIKFGVTGLVSSFYDFLIFNPLDTLGFTYSFLFDYLVDVGLLRLNILLWFKLRWSRSGDIGVMRA